MEILSFIYEIIVKFRNFCYEKNIKKIKKVDGVKIICIGNIVVGGAGKTPAVQYFAKKCISEGKKVGILSRGYKGKRIKDPFLVRDNEKIYAKVSESGDEAYLHALNLNVPVVVSKNRYEGAKYLKEKFNVDIIIMDDGFQHRKLYRDKNIVLIDATNPFGNFKYLPFGRLRESLYELKRADEIIISKSNFINKIKIYEILTILKRYNKKNVSVKMATFDKEYFYNIDKKKVSLEEIKDKKVLIFSSIANPKVFFDTIKELNPKKIEQINFEDHHMYTNLEIDKILKEASDYDYILTTEKDIVKIEDKSEKILVLKMKFEII